MLTHNPINTNPENFKRSAMEPVGMVAAVSIKTIWNRKKTRIPLLIVNPFRKKPSAPKTFCPAISRGDTSLSATQLLSVTGAKDQAGMEELISG